MENKIIKETIYFLEKAPYRERKPFMRDYYGRGVEMNGFIIQKDGWCWLIWKPTKNPAYKGEPLVKVVPQNVELEKIDIVLNAQSWSYV